MLHIQAQDQHCPHREVDGKKSQAVESSLSNSFILLTVQLECLTTLIEYLGRLSREFMAN